MLFLYVPYLSHVFYSGLAALCLMGKEKLCDTESLLLWTAKRQMRLEGGFQVSIRLEGGFQVRANQDDFFVFILGPDIFPYLCIRPLNREK
jgi:hypothetical protein